MLDQKAEMEAIDWVIQLRDPASADWTGFTLWLESSSTNSAAYDRVALSDADLPETMGETFGAVLQQPANDNRPNIMWRYGAIAAALLIMVTSYPIYNALNPTYAIETALGEQNSVSLADGSMVELNGGTRVTIDKANPRSIALNYGEARFSVKHNAASPFIVKTGDTVIQDVGTVFNVIRTDQQTEVAVSEGSVVFNPKLQAVVLTKGKKLNHHDGHDKPEISSIDPSAIGGWKAGRLSYTATPILRVASDLSRFLGKRVSVAPELKPHRFTGTIIIGRKDAQAIERISALMSVRATPTAQGWQLTAL